VPPQKTLRLTVPQRRLYDEHFGIAVFFAARYARAYPATSHDEFLQAAQIGLVRASQRWDVARGVPFGKYATKTVERACYYQLCGDWRGVSAIRNAARWEVSEEEFTGQWTFGELGDARAARNEIQHDFPEDRRQRLLCDVLQAIRSAAGLTSLERRALTLRLSDLDRETIARKLRCSIPTLRRTVFAAIGKLRAHFGNRGALPIGAPLPRDGNPDGRPRHEA
jgi:RNA polymerase sigma factor (sigma-70 family)